MSQLYFTTALAFIATVGEARAVDRTLNDKFIAEYSQSFHKLEDFYRNIDLTEESTGPGMDKKFGGTITFHWRSSGEKFRDDVTSLDGAIAQSKVSRGDVNCRIYTTSKAPLARVKRGEKYAITEIHKGDDTSLIGNARMVSPRLAFASYCVYSTTVLDLVNRDIIEVKALDEPDPGKVMMKYLTHVPGGETVESEFIFDKEKCWAITSHRNRSLLTKVEYGDTINGIPVAKRLTHYWSGDFVTPAFVSVLKDIKSGPVPDSVFTLAEFGLPELPYPKKPGFPIFGTLGIAGLIVAAVLAWVIRKRTAAAAAA